MQLLVLSTAAAFRTPEDIAIDRYQYNDRHVSNALYAVAISCAAKTCQGCLRLPVIIAHHCSLPHLLVLQVRIQFWS
jgi:hypothetical protein